MRTRLAVILLCILPVPIVKAQATKSGFFKTSDGVRIHYLEAGSGRPVVFIPGWTMPAWIWQKQIDEFSNAYHVVAVDQRGLKQPVLVGWSMACGELVKYAEQFGTDNIAGLVLVDGFLTDKPSPE